MNLKIYCCGGLGNQMFQYAFGYSLAKRIGADFILDVSAFKNYFRPFALCNYRIEGYSLSYRENFIDRIKVKIAKRLRRMNLSEGTWFKWGLLLETSPSVELWNWEEIANYEKSKLFIQGDWQCQDYFIDVREDLLKIFVPKILSDELESWSAKLEQLEKTVSLHVRRGDYVSDSAANRIHGTLSVEYYSEAIKLIRSKMDNPSFCIFSDDPQWVLDNLPISKEALIVSDGSCKDYEELYLMSKCSHNIIANSSFSWWGAWLNDNSSKIVIAPDKWFVSRPSEYIIPKNWIRL